MKLTIELHKEAFTDEDEQGNLLKTNMYVILDENGNDCVGEYMNLEDALTTLRSNVEDFEIDYYKNELLNKYIETAGSGAIYKVLEVYHGYSSGEKAIIGRIQRTNRKGKILKSTPIFTEVLIFLSDGYKCYELADPQTETQNK